METQAFSLSEPFRSIQARLTNWFGSIDQTNALIVLALLVVVYLARRHLALWVLTRSSRLMNRLSAELSAKVTKDLVDTISVLVVVLALFPVLDVMNAPDIAAGFVKRVLMSIAIMAVFSGWHSLCGPFVSLLRSDRLEGLAMETGWMTRVAQFSVILLAITSLLKVWEVDIAGALTGVGVLGAGIAIATQDLIRNLIAGMNNMRERRFRVGDVIEIEGVLAGTVESIDLRSTRIRGYDQTPRYVPNADLSNAVVLNFSHGKSRRIWVSVPLVLSSSREQIIAIRDGLRDYLTKSGDFDISADAPQHVYIEALSDSAVPIIFYARTNVASYANYLQVHERLSLKILESVKQVGTDLAYPTQTLNVDKIPAPDSNGPTAP